MMVCSFCGYHPAFPHRHRPVAWQAVAGRTVCDGDCAEKEAARQAAQPAARLLTVDEIDGRQAVDQVKWAAEHRRPETPLAPVRLYLDDVRNPPDDGGGPWTICRTVEQAKALLLRGVDEASLDHDLGQCDACRSDLGPNNCPHVGTGYDLVKWMAEHGVWPRMEPCVHSANPVGAHAMRQMIDRYWKSG
ncbi:cyclic-phosphate processing receiver domain-containing protein [Sorangium sp. So ce388]|uniref:cyclic-phosphate processing receiver domain-containing protein n=1 Tax=Sorangium sp. So ce388 TaxID=3133309 RepID=UPI003F5B0E60